MSEGIYTDFRAAYSGLQLKVCDFVDQFIDKAISSERFLSLLDNPLKEAKARRLLKEAQTIRTELRVAIRTFDHAETEIYTNSLKKLLDEIDKLIKF